MTMKNTTTRATVLAGTVYATAVIGITAATILVSPQRAIAFPAYAQKTGQHCAVCHVNPKGGGTLTKSGTKWFTGGMKAKFRK